MLERKITKFLEHHFASASDKIILLKVRAKWVNHMLFVMCVSDYLLIM